MCHVILALRPATPLKEYEIVMNWLKREEEINRLAVGQFWYLIDMTWWKQWQAYTSCDGGPGPPEANGDHFSNSKNSSSTIKCYTSVGSNR